ncbi:CPBP family intramembrane glutamic endopeptidase [Staphylococcus succinus]|uniref:CPBP family intramembrane glutamic endopeptidase n=1 Tax=Staphylococcus succinus TaxID=61015 RepID=UPI000E67ABD4|nr:type II CAAX endopeptidase family protein [Staphylococcus succinus]RIN27689.1 CPBP family intramembrane metalloprotease [Staphylococcus succinus]
MLKDLKDIFRSFCYYGYHAFIWLLIVALWLTTGETEGINHIYIWFTGVLFMLMLLITVYAKSTVSNRHSLEKQSIGKKKVDLIQCFILIITAFILTTFAKNVYEAFMGHETFANDKLISESVGMLIPFFITTSIVAPIFEEIVFRGYAYMLISDISKAICKKFNIIHYEKRITIATYIIIPSLLFGLAHKQGNVWSYLTYVLAGVVFAALFIITKRIWVGMILHFINNSYASLQMVYVKQSDYSNEWLNISYLALAIVIGVLIYKFYPKIKGVVLAYDKKYTNV